MEPHWLTHKEMDNLGPILEQNGHATRHSIGWIFWDETGAYGCGPYKTKEAANMALCQYARYI